ncbi:hypothetical protein [Planctomyces sp. SH-PL14]|uniref:hypothetical protein n=1 Tax=Planctomyces sp. SH-PL14 TaxID=1632864 RepID=UPI00078E2D6A|nr:hypothetical protein [Planctomyces sp. SH-PL14]AMV16490.1 hypothetical protein VT03_01280 [Planctomyces sp. SH-PL14]
MSRLPDDYEARVLALDDPTLREVAVLGLEGLEVIAIAEILGQTRVYVLRRVRIIRMIWAEKWGPIAPGESDGLPSL